MRLRCRLSKPNKNSGPNCRVGCNWRYQLLLLGLHGKVLVHRSDRGHCCACSHKAFQDFRCLVQAPRMPQITGRARCALPRTRKKGKIFTRVTPNRTAGSVVENSALGMMPRVSVRIHPKPLCTRLAHTKLASPNKEEETSSCSRILRTNYLVLWSFSQFSTELSRLPVLENSSVLCGAFGLSFLAHGSRGIHLVVVENVFCGVSWCPSTAAPLVFVSTDCVSGVPRRRCFCDGGLTSLTSGVARTFGICFSVVPAEVVSSCCSAGNVHNSATNRQSVVENHIPQSAGPAATRCCYCHKLHMSMPSTSQTDCPTHVSKNIREERERETAPRCRRSMVQIWSQGTVRARLGSTSSESEKLQKDGFRLEPSGPDDLRNDPGARCETPRRTLGSLMIGFFEVDEALGAAHATRTSQGSAGTKYSIEKKNLQKIIADITSPQNYKTWDCVWEQTQHTGHHTQRNLERR